MREITKDMVELLERFDWFENIGRIDYEMMSWIKPCTSWAKATEEAKKIRWQNAKLEAVNEIRAQVLKLDEERYLAWNNSVYALKPLVENIWVTCILPILKTNSNIHIENGLKWDMLHVLMEIEHSDISNVELYRTQFIWYSKGHYPCGWSGDAETGKLIIF